MKKRFLMIPLIAATIAGSSSVSALEIIQGKSSDFTDIKGHWAQSYLETGVAKGYLNGYEDLTLRPDNQITRAEYISLLTRVTARKDTSNKEYQFTDVSNHWSAKNLYTAINLGFVTADEFPNKQFQPDQSITRWELIKWAVNGLLSIDASYKDAFDKTKNTLVPSPEGFKGELSALETSYIAVAMGTGLVDGYEDGTIRLNGTATRAEVMKILTWYVDLEKKKATEFLGMRELMAVGTQGTNLFEVTPYRPTKDANTGEEDKFSSILNKPLATKTDIGDIRILHMIAVDAKPDGTYNSIYGKVFMQGIKNVYDNWYPVFMHYKYTPSYDDVGILTIANSGVGTFSTSFTGKLGEEGSGIPSHKITTIPQYDQDKFFVKGANLDYWTFKNMTNSKNTSYSIQSSDESNVGIYVPSK